MRYLKNLIKTFKEYFLFLVKTNERVCDPFFVKIQEGTALECKEEDFIETVISGAPRQKVESMDSR